MTTNETYLIGLDFGTDSVRALLVRGSDGAEAATAVFAYPRWRDGLYCHAAAQQFRQHPLDHLEGLEYVIRACLQQAGPAVAAQVKAIGLGATGSSPLPVNREGTPLALLPAFADNPNAMVVLWKDHTAIREAAEINAHAARTGTPYLQYAGGIYSSEWFWAKLLHVLRDDAAVREQTWSWVEHCDWLPFVLTGGNDVSQMKRSVCAAGHKALWAADWGGLPPAAFWESLDPLLEGFSSRLYTNTCTADQPAGTLSPAWAAKLGLPESVIVTTGALDAHVGAVGGQIEPYFLSKVMGTSTCDMLVAPAAALGQKKISGICGQVPGSVIPGLVGMEAGQSAFGDTYAWLRNLLAWPLQWLGEDGDAAGQQLRAELAARILPELNRQAALLPVHDDAPLALDWLNGRRTPDADPLLKAAITGLTLGTDAVTVFRTLAESTCFGARKIVERFATEGVPVKGLIGVGGIVKKSPFIMQLLADVLEMPIRAHAGEQTCAAGAAMFAATAAGLYPNVEAAMHAMGQGFERTYLPNGERAAVYRRRYAQYERLGYLATALYSPR
ncbi:ribulokinase [Chitinophaga parva]|uniref:Ribulokinase n=1 Tax=Chitinophaga parva TaxID=2169414 RepID=A0A2T7BD29_9BACT|nr:ribulokinase [Chitinophaga parva]PUZ23008.1 ribulokinase [Chitinophaga parva]